MTIQNNLFAEVSLPLPLDKSFHYRIPPHLSGLICRGMRVEVPFGRKNLAGYVIGCVSESPVQGLKDIAGCLDTEPARWSDIGPGAG
jgi:primosomal protein N' (replication factor Y)